MSPWLTVVGIGADGYAALGRAARRALWDAEFLLGAPRHLALLPKRLQVPAQCWPTPFRLDPVLARLGQPTCVLASGDPMFFGVGARLAQQIPPTQMRVLPAPSCCSLAAARLGWRWQELTVVSLVGRRLAGLNQHLYPNERLLILSQDGHSPAAIAQLLTQQGWGASRLWVFEHLGGAQERCLESTAQHWTHPKTAALNVVAVACCDAPFGQPTALGYGLPDACYQHDGQLTKQDVRAISVARLAPLPHELLWDVGAGCGSIGIEWLRSHPQCHAVAVEANATRAQFIRSNKDRLGVPRLQVVEGSAPNALKNLPTPDAIFIGGGLTAAGVLDFCWHALKPNGRLVANAVTLQSQALLLDWHQRYGGSLLSIQIAQAQPLGRFETWRSASPIILLVLTKSEEHCRAPGNL